MYKINFFFNVICKQNTNKPITTIFFITFYKIITIRMLLNSTLSGLIYVFLYQ